MIGPEPYSRLREAVRDRVENRDPESSPARAARWIADVAGESLRGVVFFGSRKTQAGPDGWSAHDFFLLPRDYGSFYRALGARGVQRRGPRLLAALNLVLPPNQIALTPDLGTQPPFRAKCAVITLDRLVRETGGDRKDHFCAGRLFQPTELLFASDEAARERILGALVSAHALTFEWVRPSLGARFDVETYCRTLLRVSLSREIRPEPTGRRADSLWEAQSSYLVPVYGALLEDLVEAGQLDVHGHEQYGLRRAATGTERLRTALYFDWSMARATARWFKYVVTFEDWLPYIVRKAERHSGTTIVLTPRERRLPLLFLWPRLLRFLRNKNR